METCSISGRMRKALEAEEKGMALKKFKSLLHLVAICMGKGDTKNVL